MGRSRCVGPQVRSDAQLRSSWWSTWPSTVMGSVTASLPWQSGPNDPVSPSTLHATASDARRALGHDSSGAAHLPGGPSSACSARSAPTWTASWPAPSQRIHGAFGRHFPSSGVRSSRDCGGWIGRSSTARVANSRRRLCARRCGAQQRSSAVAAGTWRSGWCAGRSWSAPTTSGSTEGCSARRQRRATGHGCARTMAQLLTFAGEDAGPAFRGGAAGRPGAARPPAPPDGRSLSRPASR